MADPGDIHRRGGIHVGGTSGIHIDVDSTTSTSDSLPGHIRDWNAIERGTLPASQSTPSIDVGPIFQLALRHPLILATVLGIGGTCAILVPAVALVLLHLPWLLLIVPALIGTILLVTAVILAAWARRRGRKNWIDSDLEHRILQFATMSGGRIALLATASTLSIPITKAEEALDLLVRRGHASVDFDTETGVVSYVFPELAAGPGRPDSNT
jgi:hypothetical protein